MTKPTRQEVQELLKSEMRLFTGNDPAWVFIDINSEMTAGQLITALDQIPASSKIGKALCGALLKSAGRIEGQEITHFRIPMAAR